MKVAIELKAIINSKFRLLKMKSFFLLIFSLLSLISIAQADIKVTQLPKFSIRASIGIPKVVSSAALRSSFSSVIATDLCVSYNLYSHFFVGLGYNYIYYKSQKHFRDEIYPAINANMQMNNGYIKIGKDHFFSDRGFTTVSLNAGLSSTKYAGLLFKADSLIGKYPTSFTSGYIEPHFGLNFLVEPNFGFGGFISYHYNFAQFNPAYPGFDKWLDYSKITNRWNISMITIGFGFYYGLGKVK